MSRCISCNKVFKPKIEYNDNGKFVKFEEMCSECIGIAYYEGNYLEEYEDQCVKEMTGMINYDLYSVKVLTQD